MPVWTYEQIAALSPDAAVLSRGRGISFARQRWMSQEGNEKLVWGEYKGGNDRIYRVAVLTGEPRFHCTCRAPSPCKHVIGLLFLLQRENDIFRVTDEPPAWVNAAFSTPAVKPVTPARDPGFQFDAKRIDQMKAGIGVLEEWLQNLIKQGFSAFADGPGNAWEGIASRMVDAKLGGVARRIRLWGERSRRDDWHEFLLGETADLHLLCQAFNRMETLPPALQRDVLIAAGVNVKREEVWAQPAVSDKWLVAGQLTGVEEKLNYRRTWLLGEKTGRSALLLDFAWGNPPAYDTQWVPGSVLEGELCFYPGSYPIRAIVKGFGYSDQPYETPAGNAGWRAFQKTLALALAANPWTGIFPAFLQGVIPAMHGQILHLVDKEGVSARVISGEKGPWPILALSGGHPISVFGEWDDGLLRPLSVFQDGRVVVL